jgi:uncharacterized protein
MIPRTFCALLFAALLSAQPAAAPDPGATARKALDLFLQQKYADLEQMFTLELAKQMPLDQLTKLGASIQEMGTPTVGSPQISRLGASTDVAAFPVAFPSAQLTVQIRLNAGGQITTFFIGRAAAPAVKWERPAYSKPDSFTEREVTVGSDQWKLPGTLTLPAGKGPFPAVALTQGSGPLDRDETLGGTKVFKDLAEGLASRGIAVLRYERRTRQYPRAASLRNLTVNDEMLEDAGRALALLRKQPEVDAKRVYLLGHSLGGAYAPLIASEDGKVAGIIVMAADLRKLEDSILDQYAYLGASPAEMESYRRQAAKVKNLEPEDVDALPVSVGNVSAPASYWISLKDYDAAEEAKGLTIPMLILHGERDYQVTMKEFAGWKAAVGGRKNVTLKSYPALNHLLVAGEGKSLPEEYAKPGHVEPEVIGDIAKFITGK